MISYIKGIVAFVTADTVVVETGGVGYECQCSAADAGYFSSKVGQNVMIYTYLSHKEDSMTLFGFSAADTRAGFLTLIKVSGIGPKMALRMLSAYRMSEIQAYIDAEDLSSLKKIPGLGAKIAGKLILDLKGKIVLPSQPSSAPGGIAGDILSALINMGYSEDIVRTVLNEHKPESDDFEKEFKQYLKLIRNV